MSAAGVIGTTINILAIGFFMCAFGYFIDFIRRVSGAFILPQYTLTTLYWLQIIFYSLGFLFFLGAIIHHLIIAKNEQTGVV